MMGRSKASVRRKSIGSKAFEFIQKKLTREEIEDIWGKKREREIWS